MTKIQTTLRNTSRDMPATIELCNKEKTFKTSIQLMPRATTQIPENLHLSKYPSHVKVITTKEEKESEIELQETPVPVQENKTSSKKN